MSSAVVPTTNGAARKAAISPIITLKKNPPIHICHDGNAYFHSDLNGMNLAKRVGLPIYNKEKTDLLAMYGAFANFADVQAWIAAKVRDGGFTAEQQADYVADIQRYVAAGSPNPPTGSLVASEVAQAKAEQAKQPRALHYLIYNKEGAVVQDPQDAGFMAGSFIGALTNGSEEIGKYVIVMDALSDQAIVTEVPVVDEDLMGFSRAFKRDINTLKIKEPDTSVRVVCKDSYAKMLVSKEARRVKQAETRASRVTKEQQSKRRQEAIRPVKVAAEGGAAQ